MSIHVTNYEDVVVLTVKDELTVDSVEGFTDGGSKCVSEGRCNIVVDCSSLGGFDSVGLEALLELQGRCEDQLGAVKLCGLDETCAKILDITRLARRFEIFGDLESAVRSFA
ncbi:MAG: STAS domain-containing protein [Phycisphaerae bacterium]|nr:STAS domain-containing protein [Phycisphaerae bacterium]